MSQAQFTADQQRGRVRRVFFFMGFFVLALILICGVSVYLIRDSFNSRREPRTVLDGALVETLVELPGDKAHPESITVGPDGNLYVSSFCTGDIWQITPDGDLSVWFDGDDGIGAAGGLAFASNGDLYVADRGDCDPQDARASLKRISADRQTVERVEGIGSNDIPNRLAVDSTTGTIYFTDTQRDEVRFIDEDGVAQTWWALPEINGQSPSPTGLAYDALNDALVIADTNSGTIYRVRFDQNRQPVLPQEILYQDNERELDGLTLDEDGIVIFTMFNTNRVARIIQGEARIIAREFREPSDVQYLDGKVYVTNFDGVSLAPLVSFFISPSLPFTVDVITMPNPDPDALLELTGTPQTRSNN